MPVDTKEWLDKEDEHSMFSPLILEKGITSWECSHCPWWLEYPLGIVPKCEQDLQARGDIHTYVDALLVEIEAIDDIAWQSIETWNNGVSTLYERVYHLKGKKSEKAGECVLCKLLATKSYISESSSRVDGDYTRVDGVLVRGGVEHTELFFSWLLATFTDEDDHVLDIFAGCGGLGMACTQKMRHCLMLQGDFLIFSKCLEKKVCGPSEDDL
ncbi:hypothetical protein L7F22_048077 [Adiantum nelumboides]|nr:hypothetical protein [Adiantum nelumboides]